MRTQTFYQPQNLGKGFGDWEKHTKVTLSFRLWLDTYLLFAVLVDVDLLKKDEELIT